MLKSYLKFAIRNLIKNPTSSTINVGGLSVGFLCAILIFIYVQKEMSFDSWHSKKDNIFRVLTIDDALGVTSNLVGITLPPLGHTMKDELPEVLNAVRISTSGRSLIEYDKKPIYSKNLIYTEKSLFDVFDFPLESGNPETVLTQPNTVVLTRTMSNKIFGVDSPLGKTIKIDNSTDLEVVGVMKDLGQSSHMEFDVLVSIIPAEQDSSTSQYLASWNSISMTTYVELNDTNSAKNLLPKMDTILRNNNVGENFSVTLQPLEDVHLNSSDILFDVYNSNKSDIEYIYTLSVVGLIVILIAAFNFMNLSTARSVNRAKEVGVRKVMGAIRQQLAIQFLFESLVLCFFSLTIALMLLSLVGLYINFDISQNLLLHFIDQNSMIVCVLAGTFVVGLIAGLYPAFILSGFTVIKILKGNFKTGSSGVFLRKALVVVQFTASIVMIIGTLVVYHQLDYLKHTNRGFKVDQIVTLSLGDQELRTRGKTLRNELRNISSVLSTAYSSSMPGRQTGRTGMQPEGAAEDDVWIVSQTLIDEDFIPLMGMEIIDGRNYSKEFGTEEQSLIINEAAAKALSWKEPVGKKISFGQNEATIVGVVGDFNFANMRHKIEPLVLQYSSNPINVLSVKVSGGDISTSIKKIKEAWLKVNPDYPFEYSFFDEEYGRQYESDQQFATLVVSFTWLAIFIACLGLLGLSTFTAQQRIKEIGIRKVMGANVVSIVVLLSKEFTKPVLVACFIALPAAWYFMDQWLQEFAYRIDMPWLSFGLACFTALLIAQLTVSFQSIKVALANPINALRYE